MVARAGTYDFDVRIANIGTGAQFRVAIDNVDRTGLVNVPNTGGWQVWQTVRITGLSLSAGAHTVRLIFGTGTAENGGVACQWSLRRSTGSMAGPSRISVPVGVVRRAARGAWWWLSRTGKRRTGMAGHTLLQAGRRLIRRHWHACLHHDEFTLAIRTGDCLVNTEHPERIDFDASSDQLWSLI